MKYFLCVVLLLPCLLAAEVKTIFCPGGIECPFGKTCCDSGISGCCDLTEEELQNKKLVPALPPTSILNASLDSPNTLHASATCVGTSCGFNKCCTGLYGGVCCPNPSYCCGGGTRCCSNTYYEQPWCCRRRDRCHTLVGYCLNGGASAKMTLVYLLFAFVLGVTSKYFL